MNVLCFNKADKLETLIHAVDTSKCVAIGFNGDENADQIRAMFAASGVTSIENLGLVQHGDITIQLGSVSLHLNSDKSGASTDDSSFSNLLDSLCKKYNISNVDIIACNMLSLWTDKLKELEQQVGANIRASNDATGNLKSGGNWIQESDDVNIAGIYFDKDKLKDYDGLLFSYGYNDKKRTYQPYFDVNGQRVSIFSTGSAFAALDEDGKVQTWGNTTNGGDSSGIPIAKIIKTIFSNDYAFAALDEDGKVHTWGNTTNGGGSSGISSDKTITTIFSNYYAFAALDEDGKVHTWGNTTNGGGSSGIPIAKTIKTIFSTYGAFAALDEDGKVYAWGDSYYGGDSSSVSSDKTITTIFSNYYAFAALDSNGQVHTWGRAGYGGSASGISSTKTIKTIFSNNEAFAALDSSGTVHAWGQSIQGGGSTGITSDKTIKTIFSTDYAFAALDSSGTVHTWGFSGYGGGPTGITSDKTIKTIFSTDIGSFAALDEDGKVYTWGNGQAGTIPTATKDDMDATTIKTIFSTEKAFAALDSNGTVHAWGNASYGGYLPPATKDDMTGKTIKTIFSTNDEFVALDSTGQFHTWGSVSYGGSLNNTVNNDISTVALGNVKFDLAHKNLDTRNVVVELTNSLENNDFSYSSFVDTDLSGVNLTGANLTGTNLSGAKLSSEVGGHWLFKHLTEAQRRQVKIDNESKTNVQMMAIDNVYEFKVVGGDDYIRETSFIVKDSSGTVLLEESGAGLYGNTPYSGSATLPPGNYTLILKDSASDGWTRDGVGSNTLRVDINLDGIIQSSEIFAHHLRTAEKTHPFTISLNLVDADLSGVDLQSVNLTSADLSGADLTGANLSSAILVGVQSGSIVGTPTLSPEYIFYNGYIVGSNVKLISADLSGVDLSGVDLTNANLTGADVTNADLTNTTLTGADLSGTNLTDVTWIGVKSGSIVGTPAQLPTNYNLTSNGYIVGPNVNLTSADLSGADLTGVNLSGATLVEVKSGSIVGTPAQLPTNYKLTSNGYIVGPNVDLTSADLSGADLSGVNLSDANLTGATLTAVKSGSIIHDNTTTLPQNYEIRSGYIVGPNVNLTSADLSGAVLTGVDLSGATLVEVKSGSIVGTPTLSPEYIFYNGYIVGPHVDLQSANLTGVLLINADFTNVNLANANFTNAKMISPIFTGATTTGITWTNVNMVNYTGLSV